MYKALLCLRYLRTRYIALASIISVTLGVATMIVVNSVMAGFSTEMRDRIHGILADVIVETNSLEGRPDAQMHMAIVREAAGEYIAGMTATVEIYGMLSFEWQGQSFTRPCTLLGIVPSEKAQVGPLVDYLDAYRTIRDGDKIVREPLRSMDEPPSWELTDEALAHRRTWMQKMKWIRQQLQGDGVSGHSEFNPLAEMNADHNLIQPASGERAGNAGPAPAPLPDADDTNPFRNPQPAQQPNNPQGDDEENAAVVDSEAPLDGRVIIGLGLISFPEEDAATGKRNTTMMVQPGDDVKISTVTAGRPPRDAHFNATIVDVFKSGMSEYDSSLVFCNLEMLQKARGMIAPDGQRSITSIQIKLKDFNDAEEVVKRLNMAFPAGLYTVRTWEQKQGPLLAAVEVESAILNVLLFLIITVAGFGILAIFYMIVVEKTRDIGVLKALGAGSGGVMSIFLSYGLALGIVGSGVGVILGLVFVNNINRIEAWITWLTGRKVFDEKIYYFPEIPTMVHPGMVLWVAVGAMLIAVLASILPARRAARLHPVDALRYE
ncbi:MAG: ABC transporter permease [Planctomycetaceae bacterium]